MPASVKSLPTPITLYYQLPRIIRRLVPPWYVVGIAGLLTSLILKDRFLFEMSGIFWYAMLLNISIYRSPNLSKAISKMPWLIGVIYAPLASLIATPAFAQATGGGGECSGGGIFGGIVTFVARTLQSLTLQGGGNVSTYVCQLVSILLIVVLLGFVAAAGATGYSVSQNRDFTAIVAPLAGVLSFVVLTTLITVALIGNA
jgi:hypothetical protein